MAQPELVTNPTPVLDTVRFVGNGPISAVMVVDGAWIAPFACTIVKVALFRRTAGLAGSTTVDVNKNGITIFTTQANRPAVTAAGGDNQISVRTNMDVTAVAQNDRIEVDVDTEETGDPADLSVILTVVF